MVINSVPFPVSFWAILYVNTAAVSATLCLCQHWKESGYGHQLGAISGFLLGDSVCQHGSSFGQPVSLPTRVFLQTLEGKRLWLSLIHI